MATRYEKSLLFIVSIKALHYVAVLAKASHTHSRGSGSTRSSITYIKVLWRSHWVKIGLGSPSTSSVSCLLRELLWCQLQLPLPTGAFCCLGGISQQTHSSYPILSPLCFCLHSLGYRIISILAQRIQVYPRDELGVMLASWDLFWPTSWCFFFLLLLSLVGIEGWFSLSVKSVRTPSAFQHVPPWRVQKLACPTVTPTASLLISGLGFLYETTIPKVPSRPQSLWCCKRQKKKICLTSSFVIQREEWS